MTVYNGMPFLPAAVESILKQSFTDFEFIIVNDGSTDGTVDYLASLTDPRVQVIHRENGGTAAAANQGLQHCRGEYIARMDSDDISLPHRLATQVEFLDNHPRVGLVGAQMAPLGSSSVGKSLILPTKHEAIYKAMLEGRHGLAHSCILLRGALLKQIGGYWKLRYQDAWDMMMRMGEVSELANIDEVLHYYRVHRASLNGKAMQRMRFSIDYARELARRRTSGLPTISVEEFQAQRDQRGPLSQIAMRIDLYARSHYRLAVAEIHGGRPAVGYLRMAWASMCQPVLFVERVVRHIAYRFTRQDDSPVQRSS
jgi:glycosyltransferase involved in cell wall biosynthesis